MSNIQIPNLPAAIALTGTEQLEAVQAGTSVRITTGQMVELVPQGPQGPQGPAGPQGPTGQTGAAGPAGPAGNASNVNTVADFQVSSFAAVVESVNILGYYSIGVGALQVRRVASEPAHPWKFRSTDRYLPNGSTDNTNGGWWEGYASDNMNLYVDSFGAVADGVTDCSNAFANAIAYIHNNIDVNPVRIYGYVLNVGLGTYYLSQSLVVQDQFTLQGVGVQYTEGSGSVLLFANGIHGIVVYNLQASGLTATGVRGNIIQNLSIQCLGTNAPGWAYDANDGIHIRGIVKIYNVDVNGFSRDGININASVSGTPGPNGTLGNANVWLIENSLIFNCGRAGLFTSNGDANAGTSINVVVSSCGQYGIYENSFLGNTHVGSQVDGTGLASEIPRFNKSVFVTDGLGNSYVVKPGQEAAAATAPLSNTTVWANKGTYYPHVTWSNCALFGQVRYLDHLFTVIPGQEALMWTTAPQIGGNAVWTDLGSWASLSGPGDPYDTAEGYQYNFFVLWIENWNPYREGAAYWAANGTGRNSFVNCYAEGGDIDSYLLPPSLVLNGYNMSPAQAPYLGSNQYYGGLFSSVNISTLNTASTGNYQWVTLGKSIRDDSIVTWRYNEQPSQAGVYSFSLDGVASTGDWGAYYYTHRYFLATGDSTAKTFGRSVAQPYKVFIDNLFIGSSATNGRQVTSSSAAPSTGEWASGDISLNISGGVGTPIAWRCTTGGTPGTWEALYPSAAPDLGVKTYAGLPAANTVPNGTRAIITDCNSTTLGATAAAGGANRVPVNSDTTNWIIG